MESLFTDLPLEECIDLVVNYNTEAKYNPDLKLSKPEPQQTQLLPRLTSHSTILSI